MFRRMDTNHTPADGAPSLATSFIPTHVSARHDGWTAARQAAFIEALAETGCVSDAAAAAGVSVRSAYRLRRHPQARAFDRAWDKAIALAARRLTSIAFERAIKGRARPIVAKGEIVGEEHVPSDQLLMFLLRHHDPQRYGDFLGFKRREQADPPRDAGDALPRLLAGLTDVAEDGA